MPAYHTFLLLDLRRSHFSSSGEYLLPIVAESPLNGLNAGFATTQGRRETDIDNHSHLAD
jgi:hypothetical protein